MPYVTATQHITISTIAYQKYWEAKLGGTSKLSDYSANQVMQARPKE